MLVPTTEEITQEIAEALRELVGALVSLICAGIAMRGDGSASLYLLMLPVILAPAALWRAALTWHRVNDFYLHLCREERLRFESSLGLSGRLVALLLLVTGALFGYCAAAAWWAGDTSALAAASGAVVNAFLVRTVWQKFSGIIAMETRLNSCKISCDVLEKADGEEDEAPLSVARLTPVTESASLALRRAGADDPLRAESAQPGHKEHEKGQGASFNPVDAVRLGRTLSRWARSQEEVDGMVAAAARRSRGCALELACLFAVLFASVSVALGIRHAASYPVLTESMTAAGHMVPRFSPQGREYDLLADSAQMELDLFIQCDPEDTARLQVQWPGRSMIDASRTCTAINRLQKGRMFPAMVNATVDNGLWSTEYVFRVQPMQILAKSLVVHGTIGQNEFTRCVPWGELPGTSVSLPANIKDVTLEVGTDTYEFNLPEDLAATGAETHDHRDFITGFYGGLAAEECDEDCRHHPRCVAHASVDTGCYQIIGPHECMKHHGSAPRHRDVKDAEVRRFLEQRTQSRQ